MLLVVGIYAVGLGVVGVRDALDALSEKDREALWAQYPEAETSVLHLARRRPAWQRQTWIDRGHVGESRNESGHVNAVRCRRMQPDYLFLRASRLRSDVSEIRAEARERALRAQAQALIKTWVVKLRAASTVQVDEAAIARVVGTYEEMARERARDKSRGHPDRSKPGEGRHPS